MGWAKWYETDPNAALNAGYTLAHYNKYLKSAGIISVSISPVNNNNLAPNLENSFTNGFKPIHQPHPSSFAPQSHATTQQGYYQGQHNDPHNESNRSRSPTPVHHRSWTPTTQQQDQRQQQHQHQHHHHHQNQQYHQQQLQQQHQQQQHVQHRYPPNLMQPNRSITAH